MSYVRELFGDLVVATTELAEAGAPPDERWLWLVIASGIARAANPQDAPADAIDTLAHLVWETPLGAALAERARRARAWPERCLHRSALELLRDVFPDREIETADLELAMIAARAPSVDADADADANGGAGAIQPPDIPEHHWWWHAVAPPGELRVNAQMSALLSLGATQVPLAFRRLVRAGFVAPGDRVYLRGHAPRDEAGDPTTSECEHNVIDVAKCLPPDDSRRPVDLAGSALACARWLAAELRRTFAFRYRIIATVRREAMASTIRFHRMRGPRWVLDRTADEADQAVLVLDSR